MEGGDSAADHAGICVAFGRGIRADAAGAALCRLGSGTIPATVDYCPGIGGGGGIGLPCRRFCSAWASMLIYIWPSLSCCPLLFPEPTGLYTTSLPAPGL